jgi:VWFA-related protein
VKRNSLGIISAIGLIAATPLGAIAPSAASAYSQHQAILRVTTRLVVVNVVVRDKKGEPIQGLTQDDFNLFDGGRPQKISFFSVQSGQSLQQSLQLLPANTYSNRASRQGDLPGNATVILLDGLNTRVQDRSYARHQVIRFLAQLQPQDRVAIYVLGRRLTVLQDFTSDPAALLEAVEHGQDATAGSDTSAIHFDGLSGASATAAKRLDGGLSSMMQAHEGGLSATMLAHERGDDALRQRDVRSVYETVEAIAHHLSGFPGRKSIIWLTGAVPTAGPCTISAREGNTPTDDPLYHQMVRELNQDDVAVYPADARGLLVDIGLRTAPNAAPITARQLQGGASLAFFCVTAGMNDLAQQTGGQAFHDTALSSAIRKALDDSAFTYTLGYYPDHGQWDGSYRTIKVQVDVKGVELRSRQGYFASADQPVGKSKDRLVLLQEAADDPLEATGIGLTVRATPFRGSRDEKLEVEVSINPHELEFRPERDRWVGLIDVWTGEYSRTGRYVRGFLKTVQENWKDPTYRSTIENGLSITNYVSVRPDAQELRVVVRDGLSGSLGSVRIPLRELSARRTPAPG